MIVAWENSADFVAAVSMFAALEGACLATRSAETLPYLGMARAELTDYGMRLPMHLEHVPVESFLEVLAELEELLTHMLSSSPDLTLTLRLHAARQILREGIAL